VMDFPPSTAFRTMEDSGYADSKFEVSTGSRIVCVFPSNHIEETPKNLQRVVVKLDAHSCRAAEKAFIGRANFPPTTLDSSVRGNHHSLIGVVPALLHHVQITTIERAIEARERLHGLAEVAQVFVSRDRLLNNRCVRLIIHLQSHVALLFRLCVSCDGKRTESYEEHDQNSRGHVHCGIAVMQPGVATECDIGGRSLYKRNSIPCWMQESAQCFRDF